MCFLVDFLAIFLKLDQEEKECWLWRFGPGSFSFLLSFPIKLTKRMSLKGGGGRHCGDHMYI